MVVRLRFARHGARNSPFYHLVAIRDSAPRNARPIEKLGEYDPVPRVYAAQGVPGAGASSSSSSKGASSSSASSYARGEDGVFTSGLPRPEQLVKEKRIEWNSERIRYWLGVGAQPSKPVARLLERAGLIPPGKFFRGMQAPAPAAPESDVAAASGVGSQTAGVLRAAGVPPAAAARPLPGAAAAARGAGEGAARRSSPSTEARRVGRGEETHSQAA